MRRKVTNPTPAMSKSKVDDVQREIQAMAVAMGLRAKEDAAIARRLMAVWQAMQNAQSR